MGAPKRPAVTGPAVFEYAAGTGREHSHLLADAARQSSHRPTPLLFTSPLQEANFSGEV
jgi:hypothetical protein